MSDSESEEDVIDIFAEFNKFIRDNSIRLWDSTKISSMFLVHCLAKHIITDDIKTEIDDIRTTRGKVERFYQTFREQPDDLVGVIDILKTLGQRAAAETLEKFPYIHLIKQRKQPKRAKSKYDVKLTDAQKKEVEANKKKNRTPNVVKDPPKKGDSDSQKYGEITLGKKLQAITKTQRECYDPSVTASHIKEAVSSIDDRYASGGEDKGLALIVNVITFDREPANNRDGAKNDTTNLTAVLQEKNFKVYTLENPSYEELEDALKQFQKVTYKTADSFLLAVMSHGDGEQIITSDSRRFKIWKILGMFNNVECPGLQGKPKMFIFNYCRGNQTDLGVMADSSSSRPGGSSTQKDNWTDSFDTLKIPSWTDMLVFYSTLDNHYAYRDAQHGSWFIQTFCEVLRETNGYHIQELLNIVSEVMKKNNSPEKQICPSYNIGFTKKFYL